MAKQAAHARLPRPQFRPSSAYDSTHWTTNNGAPVWNNNNSLTVGDRGEVGRAGGRGGAGGPRPQRSVQCRVHEQQLSLREGYSHWALHALVPACSCANSAAAPAEARSLRPQTLL